MRGALRVGLGSERRATGGRCMKRTRERQENIKEGEEAASHRCRKRRLGNRGVIQRGSEPERGLQFKYVIVSCLRLVPTV